MKNNNRILSVLSVLFLTTVAASPLLCDVEDAEATPWLDEGTTEAIYWWLRVLPVTSQVVGAYEYLTLNQREEQPSVGDDDAVKAYARDVDALRSAEQMYNIYGIASSLVKTDIETWKLTNSYLNRAAETAAGSLWSAGAKLDSDSVLDYGNIYDSVGNGNRNTQETLDEAIRISADLKQVWNNTNYGKSLEISLDWNDGSTGNAADRLTLDFMTLATVTSTRNVVYLTQTNTQNAPDTATTIYAYTTTGTITPISPGSPSMPLNLGANDISSLPSGFYELSPGVYGGPFLTGTNDNHAYVKGAAGIIKDDQYGYITVDNDAIATNDYGNITVLWNGITYTSATLDFIISGSSETRTSLNAPYELVTSYVAYIDQLSDLLFEASKSAEVMWSICAQANTSNILLSPSSVIPSLRNYNLSTEQAYALYILALDQIGQYNSAYGETLKDGMTKISAQSLDLYCHGDIHAANGTIVAKDVIFSPYVYTKDWTIYAGENNIMNQAGMVMIWDTGTTAIGWEGPQSSDNYATLLMDAGQYMTISEIHYKGQLIPSLKLEVKSIEQIDVFSGIDWDREDSPTILSATTLIAVILIEASIIIALLGYATGIRWLYLASLIVFAIGLFGSEHVAGIILGLI